MSDFPIGVEPRCFALVPAAGVGSRSGADRPKQYVPLAGQAMIAHTLAALAAVPRIEATLVVLSPEDDQFEQAVPGFDGPRSWVARCGGASRAETVANGLQVLREHGVAPHDWVLVHDAARCLLQPAWVDRLIDACEDDEVGGLLALPVADTLKSASATLEATATPSAAANATPSVTPTEMPPAATPAAADSARAGLASLSAAISARAGSASISAAISASSPASGSASGVAPSPASSPADAAPTSTACARVASTVDRRGKWAAQTPQMFRLGLLAPALAAGLEGVTDEASAVEALGHQPLLVEASMENFKVTWPADFALAERLLRSR